MPSVQPPQTRTIRVLVVAAYPSVRAGLGALLDRDPEIDVIEANPGRLDPNRDDLDVIVVDVATEGDALDDLLGLFPSLPLVLIGADAAGDRPDNQSAPVAYLSADVDAAALAAAVKAVAAGLIVLDAELISATGFHLHSHVQPVAAAGEALTTREREVLELVAAGLPNKAIARELGISEHTAKFHVGSLLAKLGAGSRTEAVTIATRRGLLAV
jgi:DNA-binding NarL/FixJ family response regulator